MFSYLPALLLFLLHGPSNFERLIQNGVLPATPANRAVQALAGIPNGSGQAKTQTQRHSAAQLRTLARLLGKTPTLSLLAAFGIPLCEERNDSPAAVIEAATASRLPRLVDPQTFSEGHSRAQRDRAGPQIA